MSAALPLRLSARPDEPGHGVLVRLGARNGYASPNRLALSLGLDFRKVLTGHYVPKIAAAAGLDPDQVQLSSPQVAMPARKVALHGVELDGRDWSTKTRRFCIECCREDTAEARHFDIAPSAYVSHRSFWDVRLIAGCPVHRCSLTRCCYRCGWTLGWQNTNLLECPRCQADLLSGTSESLDDGVGRYVARRLRGRAGGIELLDRMPVSKAMRLCERLGQITAVGPAPTLPRQSTGALLAARNLGFAMSQDLDNSVPAALNAIVVTAEAHKGLTGSYGWIYTEWLGPGDGLHAPVKHLLFNHAVSRGIIAAGEARLGNSPRQTVSMTAAARLLGVGYASARRAADANNIIPPGSRRSVPFALEPALVSQLSSGAEPMLSLKKVAALLSTGKAQVLSLMAEGHLISNDQRVGHEAIEDLIAALIAGCAVGRRPRRTITLGRAARNASVSLCRIIDEIKKGPLICWRGPGVGLAQFNVRMRDVLRLRPAASKLSVEAVAGRLGVHPDCVRALLRDKAICSADGVITEEALATVEDEFVVGAVLASRLGRSPRALHRDLLNAGIEPAYDLTTHQQAIYRRSDLNAFKAKYA